MKLRSFVIKLLLIALFVTTSARSYFKSEVNRYDVSVMFNGAKIGQQLENIYVIVGADKFWWASILSGKQENASLSSAKNTKNELTLQDALQLKI